MTNKNNKWVCCLCFSASSSCVCLIAANILEYKANICVWYLIDGWTHRFPYLLHHQRLCLWGVGIPKARLLIWTGFAMNFFFVAMGALCDWIPGAPYWTNDAGFHAIFGLAPRVAAASFVAFIVGSFANAYVMSKMKLRDGGRHFSWRAILSTIAGESLDSLIFLSTGIRRCCSYSRLPKLMLCRVVLKTLYEVIALPLTIRVVKKLKQYEAKTFMMKV